jgi:hypothetical protein
MPGPSVRVESVLAQEARKIRDTFCTCSASRFRSPCVRILTVYASRFVADGGWLLPACVVADARFGLVVRDRTRAVTRRGIIIE